MGGLTETAADERYVRLTPPVLTIPSCGAAMRVSDPGFGRTVTRGILNANCAITLPAPVLGRRFRLILVQNGTGGWTPSWVGAVTWTTGTPPVFAPPPGAITRLDFNCDDGQTWDGHQYTGSTSSSSTPVSFASTEKYANG